MKRFTSIHDVSIKDVLEALCAWEDGSLSYEEVQAWAERILLSGWHEYPKDDPRSILAHVVQLLEDIYTMPVLKNDVPTLRQVLKESKNSPSRAWKQLDAFRETTNWEYRRQQARLNLQMHNDQLLDMIIDL